MSRLVQLSKGGASYDIYIGPAKNNSSWQLHQSKWYFPEIRSMEEYKKAVEKKALDVSELEGKVLACFCGPTKRCHGNVLLYLVQHQINCEASPSSSNEIVSVHLFKGDSSPFSNSFKLKSFSWEGNTFHSLAHAYYYCIAEMNGGKPKILQRILQAPTLSAAHSAWKDSWPCPALTSEKRIALVYGMLQQKWKQCKQFRHACREFADNLIIQDLPDRFWGSGPHSENDNAGTFIGLNIAGWLIVALIEMKSKNCQGFLFDKMKLRQIMCSQGKANQQLLEGALLVSEHVCPPRT
jgi:predicted NAD-dependent protein-ADP-ribosyltransferase YbiA (DUF1768 family)